MKTIIEPFKIKMIEPIDRSLSEAGGTPRPEDHRSPDELEAFHGEV
jgi:hypothetical protein